MKTPVPILFMLAITQAVVADYGPPVLETADEFFAYGDFGANGLRSYVVIDRASGGLRQANAAGDGVSVVDAVATGASGLSGVEVGRFEFADRDAVAVTSPETNRVTIVGQYGFLRDAWPTGVGPRDIAGLPVPGSGSGLDGLAALTVLNDPSSGSYRRDLMENTGGTFASWCVQTPTPGQAPGRALAVVRQPGDTPRYAELRSENGNDLFAVHDSQDPALPVLASCAGVMPGSTICYGHFNPNHSRSVLVFHVPGASDIQVSAFDPSFQLSAPVTHNLGLASAWVLPVPADDGVRLVACDDTGANLRVWRFGDTNVPSLVQTLPAPAGWVWRGLLAAADGGWFAASGLAGGRETLSLQRFTYQGAPLDRFAEGPAYDMAPLRAEELFGDVLLFSGEPFVDDSPVLKGRLRAGGWTSNLSVGLESGGKINSQRETWQGPALGLSGGDIVSLGGTPAGVTHGWANQIQPDASFYSMETPVGLVPDWVSFDPPQGPQTTEVTVTLTVNNPVTSIYYSLGNSNSWVLYASPLGPFHATTTIHAYAADGTIKTPIVSATYTFPDYPGDIDSDGDGVPDFVENHFGIDPADSLADADMDGVPDLMEILAGTDPADRNSVPDQAAVLAYSRRFNLSAEPLSHNGASYGDILTLLPCFDIVPPDTLHESTWVTITRPDGLLEAEGMARTTPSGILLAETERIVPNPPLFWVAGTPDRFMIDIQDGSDFRHGRGVFRLLDWSARPLEPLPRPELSGSNVAMVDQWVSAMRAHFSANAPVDAGGEVSFAETVDLLLAERALARIFKTRELIPNEKITLTPFRGDAFPDRNVISDQWLLDLPLQWIVEDSSPPTVVDNGYDWSALLAFIRTGQAGSQTREGLDQLAREFYRIGFYAFSDPDNPLNLSPFDALREFMDTGAIPAEYQPLLSTPASIITASLQYLDSFLSWLPGREHTLAPFTLVAASGFNQDPWLCLTSQSTGITYWLAEPDGKPFTRSTGLYIQTGFRFLVGGHMVDRPEGGRYMLVDSFQFLDSPTLTFEDTDNNMLVDLWEAFLFGRLFNRPFADADGDGYSTLQEMFERTDPTYHYSWPGVPILDLRPPSLAIEHLGDRHFLISWQWPTRYQDRIGFFIDGTQDFRSNQRIINRVHGNTAGFYETEVDATTHPPTYFYRAGMELK